MEVKITTDGDITIATPIGRIDTSTAKVFEDALMNAANTNSKIAVHFKEIDYISSAGLRVVLMLGKKLTAAKGVLVLIDMPEKIFAVFKMSGFDKILKICASFEEAKQFFN
ncbi:MAG: STAS domain-containing protein [Holosporaceae bacterium]|jgi:anti-anti-sigma factor|nr:STAS domain-containing protein [Holosporaceae bacterium]